MSTRPKQDHVAQAEITIAAPRARIWHALVTPAEITKYMFGTRVTSDFSKGSPITWKGEWQGKPYEDKGRVLDIERERLLRYSHFSPLTGQPDVPENYHTVVVMLSDAGKGTRVALTQNNNPTDDAREHSEKNWRMMLEGLKKLVEGAPR